MKLKCDEVLSNFAFNLNVRRHIKATVTVVLEAASGLGQVEEEKDEAEDLNRGNLAGSIHAALDVSSSASSVRSLPPLGVGWCKSNPVEARLGID